LNLRLLHMEDMDEAMGLQLAQQFLVQWRKDKHSLPQLLFRQYPYGWITFEQSFHTCSSIHLVVEQLQSLQVSLT
jgi:hypothetical protein